MTYYTKCIFFLTIIGILSCKNKVEKVYYENGKIKESYTIDDNKSKDGKYEAFYENGVLREMATYHHNILSGKKSIYRIDGSLEIEENYDQNGQLQGPYIVYHSDGKSIHIVRNYKDNMIQGILKVYYPNGKIKEEVTMIDNEENGPFTEYYQNGAIEWKGIYRNGTNEYGDLFQYDSLGVLIKKMLCDSQAICRTIWKLQTLDPPTKQ